MRLHWTWIVPLVLYSLPSGAVVDMKNANFSDTWKFIEVPGVGYDLSVVGTYNSRSLHNGKLGFGWCSNLETNLEITPEGSLRLTECGDGMETVFTPQGSAEELKAAVAQITKEVRTREPGKPDKYYKDIETQLMNDPDVRIDYAKRFKIKRDIKEGTAFHANGKGVDVIYKKPDGFTRTLQDGSSQKFDLNGNLSHLFDRNGNSIKFTWKSEQIQDIIDSNGRKLSFTYHTNGKVKEIIGPNKLTAEFKYKNLQDLSSVKTATGNNFEFAYDDLHNMTKVKYPDNTTKELSYDTNKDWVTSFKDREGCKEDYDYVLSKDDPKNHYWSTVTKKCAGKVTNRSRFEFWYKLRKDGNGKYLEKALLDINGDKTEMVYHEIFGKPMMVKKNGKTTTFAYYENGLVKTREFNKEVTEFTYDGKTSKVTKVKVGKRQTDFEYDGRGNLTSAKNTIGQSVKLKYDDEGRISYIEDQAKRQVKIAYEKQFGKPNYVERIGVGSINVTYKANGEIDKFESASGPSVAVQVASTFNNLLDVIQPAGIDLGL
ncbi:MAG: cell wall-associated protein wapA [Bdellovibrionales bacterium]|nr:cell wall-associated protein wapA [Bdellovibrionales bacterium]